MNDRSDLERDLEALRTLTARDIPELEPTLETIRRREPVPGPPLGTARRKLMALLHSIRTRPALAAGLAVALVALIGMVVPVSYDRITGEDVALTIAGKGVGPEEVASVARDFKAALGSGPVMVEATEDGAAPRFVLRASLPGRPATGVRRSTLEFARALAARGVSASVQVTPRRERVRYPAVAYAFDRIIRISVDGKTAAALEREIKDRLVQAGVPDAQVSVTDAPGGGHEIRMTVEREHEGAPGAAPLEPVPQIELTKNGVPLPGQEGTSVKIQKKKVDGATTLLVDVTLNGRSGHAEVAHAETMGDAALADAIRTQLLQAGLNVRVTVAGGRISIDPVK
jgi:hypothetical protein